MHYYDKGECPICAEDIVEVIKMIMKDSEGCTTSIDVSIASLVLQPIIMEQNSFIMSKASSSSSSFPYPSITLPTMDDFLVSSSSWNFSHIRSVFESECKGVQWKEIMMKCIDSESPVVNCPSSFVFLNEMYRELSGDKSLPIDLFTSSCWKHLKSQLRMLECILSVPPNVFSLSNSTNSISLLPNTPLPNPLLSHWLSRDLLSLILTLTHSPFPERVRRLLAFPMNESPLLLIQSLTQIVNVQGKENRMDRVWSLLVSVCVQRILNDYRNRTPADPSTAFWPPLISRSINDLYRVNKRVCVSGLIASCCHSELNVAMVVSVIRENTSLLDDMLMTTEISRVSLPIAFYLLIHHPRSFGFKEFIQKQLSTNRIYFLKQFIQFLMCHFEGNVNESVIQFSPAQFVDIVVFLEESIFDDRFWRVSDVNSSSSSSTTTTTTSSSSSSSLRVPRALSHLRIEFQRKMEGILKNAVIDRLYRELIIRRAVKMMGECLSDQVSSYHLIQSLVQLSNSKCVLHQLSVKFFVDSLIDELMYLSDYNQSQLFKLAHVCACVLCVQGLLSHIQKSTITHFLQDVLIQSLSLTEPVTLFACRVIQLCVYFCACVKDCSLSPSDSFFANLRVICQMKSIFLPLLSFLHLFLTCSVHSNQSMKNCGNGNENENMNENDKSVSECMSLPSTFDSIPSIISLSSLSMIGILVNVSVSESHESSTSPAQTSCLFSHAFHTLSMSARDTLFAVPFMPTHVTDHVLSTSMDASLTSATTAGATAMSSSIASSAASTTATTSSTTATTSSTSTSLPPYRPLFQSSASSSSSSSSTTTSLLSSASTSLFFSYSVKEKELDVSSLSSTLVPLSSTASTVSTIRSPPSEQSITSDRVLVTQLLAELTSESLSVCVSELKRFLNASPSVAQPLITQYLLGSVYRATPSHQKLLADVMDQLNDYSMYIDIQKKSVALSRSLMDALAVCMNACKNLSFVSLTPEHSCLMNMGRWIGELTLARNKPLLLFVLDLRVLLLQALKNDQLVIVYPFVCELMGVCLKSDVFKSYNQP